MENFDFDGWKIWEKCGKTDFIQKCKEICELDSDSVVLNYLIHELFLKTLQGTLKRDQFVDTVRDLANSNSQLSIVLVDVSSIVAAEVSEDAEKKTFLELIYDLDTVVPSLLLKERLEIDTLQEAGILNDKAFSAKFIKVKTKLFYKQRKFNLFREESEGYSKLIVELANEFVEKSRPEIILNVIKSLIGCFNLDPNRVLDIILESFERKPHNFQFYVQLISQFMNDPKVISEILGFKFRFYEKNDIVAPDSLFLVAAFLLQYEIISFDGIYCWLTPDDLLLWSERDKQLADAREYVRKLNVVSLKEKDDAAEIKENFMQKYNCNQKFRLCQALLEVGDWKTALILIRKLPENFVVEQEPVAKVFCKLINWIVEPIYKKYFDFGNRRSASQCRYFQDNPKSPKVIDKLSDIRNEVIELLKILGPSIHYDPILMHKMIRICREIVQTAERKDESQTDPLFYDVLTVFDVSIMPSLSYMDSNCCVAEEIWSVLKSFSYQHRYPLYNRWKNESHKTHPKLIRKRGDAQKQIKNIMKRISKENVKPMGRLIGKLTHNEPGVLFDYILLQIQIYDNLIAPVIDSLRYLTGLSFDMLAYCLIECLSRDEKTRFKHDGTSIAMWLQNLSAFCGAIFKKYSIELTGLLQFVANQLKAKRSSDLLILKEIVTKMTGIEVAEELTMDQLSAMSGGELLKAEAGYFSQVRNTKRSSIRLKEAMGDHDLAVALCLLIAQQKYCVLYCENQNGHLKLIGKLFDNCQDTLVQFGNFLGSTFSIDEYVSKLPSIRNMLLDYHIQTDVAFFLSRPMLTYAINAKFDQLKKADGSHKKLSTSALYQKYAEATTEVMNPVYESVIPLHPAKIWDELTPQFLVTFWSLVMYDLFVPVESYNKEMGRLKQLAQQSLENKELTSSKTKKEQDRYNTLIEKLQDEKKKQQEHVDRMMYRLKQEKDNWFPSRSAKSAKNETITQFLQLCLFPRCIFTAIDAVYCSFFVQTIHNLKTANFSTLLCYDRLFCNITYSVTSCTENEANRYGRFLCLMLETVMKWHSSKTNFDKECAGFPGFVTKYRVSNQYTEACEEVGYENYRHVCHKWHYKIAKALIICLDSKDYVQIRNALIILIKILPHFPVLIKLNQIIERKIEKLREEEKNKRQDLFVIATSYIGLLKNRTGCTIKDSDFHLVNDKNLPSHNSSQAQKTPADHAGQTSEKNDAKSTEKDGKTREKKSTPTTTSKVVSKTNAVANTNNHTVADSKNEKNEAYLKDDTSKKDETEIEAKKRDRKEEKSAKESARNQDSSHAKDEMSNGTNGEERDHKRNQHDNDYDKEVKRRKIESSVSISASTSTSLSLSSKNVSSSPSSTSNDNVKTTKTDDSPVIIVSSSSSSSSSSTSTSSYIASSNGTSSEKKDKTVSRRSSKDRSVSASANAGTVTESKKERKVTRKRDRSDETLVNEQKKRKDEDRAITKQNGDSSDAIHQKDRHRSNRDEKSSPHLRDTRDRNHDPDMRDKHSRRSQANDIKKNR